MLLLFSPWSYNSYVLKIGFFAYFLSSYCQLAVIYLNVVEIIHKLYDFKSHVTLLDALGMQFFIGICFISFLYSLALLKLTWNTMTVANQLQNGKEQFLLSLGNKK